METAEKKQKQKKPNPLDNPSNHITKRLTPKFFDDPVKKIRDTFINYLLEDISNILVEFFQACPTKYFREATMYLHVHFCKSIKTDPCPFIQKEKALKILIEKIVENFRDFLKSKDVHFVDAVNAGYDSNNSWEYSFVDAVNLDVSKYADTLDQLFQIRILVEKTKTAKNGRAKSFYEFIHRMFFNQKTKNNAINWIQIFNLDLQKIVEPIKKKSPSITIYQWSRLVEDTTTRLCDLYSRGVTAEVSNCIVDFNTNCRKEWIRGATMDLSSSSHLLLSKVEDSNPSLIVFQIFMGFHDFLDKKGKHFSEEVLSVDVPDDLWEKSFKVAIQQKRAACYPALNMLFKIQQPENPARKESIYQSIGELLDNKKTINNGLEKIQSFGIDLEQLKIRDTVVIDEDRSWEEYVEHIFNEIQKHGNDTKKIDYALQLFFIRHKDKDKRFQNIDAYFKDLHLKTGFEISVMLCPIKSLRRVTMELLIKIESTNTNSTNLIHRICKCFYFSAHRDFDEYIVDIPDEVWEKAWKICISNPLLQALKASSALELLFRITQPETEARKSIIYDSVRKMIAKTESFDNAVKWINTYNFNELKEEQFGDVVIYSLFFEKGKQTVFNNFPDRVDKMRYLKTLDELLYKVKNNAFPKLLDKEKQEYIIEKLLRHIRSLATLLDVDLKAENYNAYQEMFIQEKRIKFEFLPRPYFDIYVKEYILHLDDEHKRWFLQSLLADKPYAYCWAKYFQISDHDLPKELKSCIVSGIDYERFYIEMFDRVNHPVDKDNEEICKFWGKSYKLYTILTVEALEKFIDKYFINPSPNLVVGIDIESGKAYEAAVLQLATTEWVCLIDVQELADKLSEEQWIRFFNLLFDPNIIRVGFAFKNDYDFLCTKFPFLNEFFQDPGRKVFCLQKLSNYILKYKNIVEKLFCNEIFENIGLANFTKAVLNINMDKTEQKGTWHRRPLTQFQKIYAVVDALIVVLLKNQIEETIAKICPEKLNDIMENGYIHYEIPK